MKKQGRRRRTKQASEKYFLKGQRNQVKSQMRQKDGTLINYTRLY